MFPTTFYPDSYFAPRYYPKVGSASTTVAGPYYFVAAALYAAGAAAGVIYAAGASAGTVYGAGASVGQVTTE